MTVDLMKTHGFKYLVKKDGTINRILSNGDVVFSKLRNLENAKKLATSTDTMYLVPLAQEFLEKYNRACVKHPVEVF